MADKKDDKPWYQPLINLADAVLTPSPKETGVRQSSAGPLGADASREARRNPLAAVMRARPSPGETIDPMGRRVGRAAPVENFLQTFASNIHPIDYGVSLAKSLTRPQDMLQVGDLIGSWQRGSALWRRKADFDEYKRKNPNVPDSRNPYNITDDWYTNFYRQTQTTTGVAGGEPVLVDLPGLDFTKKDKTGKVVKDKAAIREQVLRDMYTSGIIANHYSSVNPSTGRREWDWNAVQQTIAQNPIDAILAVTPLVEAGAVKSSAQLGKLFNATGAAARVERGTRAASNITRMAVNPLGEVVAPALTRAGVRAATRTVGRGADILSPEYTAAFSAFKQQGIDELVANGMSRREAARTVNDPANQDQIFLQFNRENNGRFLNPYNEEVTQAMQGTTVSPTGNTPIDPTVLGLPSYQSVVGNVISRRGGVSGPVLREAVARASGAPTVTRSMTTGESPGYLWDLRGGEERARQMALSGIGERPSGPAPGEIFETGTIGNYRYDPDAGWVYAGSGRPVNTSVADYLNEQWQGRQAPISEYGAEIATSPYRTPQFARGLAQRAYSKIAPQLGGLAGFGYFLQGIPGAVTGLGLEGVKEAGSAALGAMGLRDRFGAPTVISPSSWYAKPESFAQGLTRTPPPLPLQLTAPGASVLTQGAEALAETPPILRPKPAAPTTAAAPVAQEEIKVVLPKVTEQYKPASYGSFGMEGITLPPVTTSGAEIKPFALSPEQQKELEAFGGNPQQGFEEGGRVAYRNGGKVSGIEPLVQALMRKYKQARSMETKSTQPLLDTPDQAIVKALSVAKKAI